MKITLEATFRTNKSLAEWLRHFANDVENNAVSSNCRGGLHIAEGNFDWVDWVEYNLDFTDNNTIYLGYADALW